MPPEVNLKKIEKMAYMSFHEDGIIDMFIGFYAILFGIIFYVEPGMYFFFLGFVIVGPPAYIWLKNRITVPRIGLVRFKSERTARIEKLRQIITAIVVLAVIVTNAIWILSAMKALPGPVSDFLDRYYMVYFGVILSAILIIGAYLADLKRFYAYGIVVIATFVCLHFLDVSGKLGAAMTIAGIIILLSGTLLLIKFMIKYPAIKEGSTVTGC